MHRERFRYRRKNRVNLCCFAIFLSNQIHSTARLKTTIYQINYEEGHLNVERLENFLIEFYSIEFSPYLRINHVYELSVIVNEFISLLVNGASL